MLKYILIFAKMANIKKKKIFFSLKNLVQNCL